MTDETFMGWIQLHERAWGTEKYADRPTLKDMLNAPVLVFWYPHNRAHDHRFTASVYPSMMEVNKHATLMLVESKFKVPARRIARLFVDQRRVRIRGVRVLIEQIPPQT